MVDNTSERRQWERLDGLGNDSDMEMACPLYPPECTSQTTKLFARKRQEIYRQGHEKNDSRNEYERLLET